MAVSEPGSRTEYDLPKVTERLKAAALCEYCFFGGPASLFAYPRDDWFEPNMLTTKAVISNR
jgi:hypothetical protein